MFILGNLFLAIGKLLHFLINAYIIVIIIHSVMSWFNMRQNQITYMVNSIVQPYLIKLREILPFGMASGGIDFTPLVGILILYFIDGFVIRSIIDIGRSLL